MKVDMKEYTFYFIPAFFGGFCANKFLMQMSVVDSTIQAFIVTCVIAFFISRVLDKPVELV